MSDHIVLFLLPSFIFFCLQAEYLTQVDLEEERDSQEMNAMQRFDKGDEKATTVLHLLEKLSKAEQMPLYYCGGFEILSQAVNDCEFSFRIIFAQLSLSVHS